MTHHSVQPKRAEQAGGGLLRSHDNRWLKKFRAALRGAAQSQVRELAVEGPHLVAEALRSPVSVEVILLGPEGEKQLTTLGPLLREYELARGKTPAVLRTSGALFASVAATETPQGIAAIITPRQSALGDVLNCATPLVVVLVGVQDPGNVGTAIRSAEAFGAAGAIAAKGTASPWSQKALRASAGSALRLSIITGVAAPVVLAQLRISGLRLCAACPRASAGRQTSMPDCVDLRGPVALLIGNETAGLSDDILNSADLLLQVPLASPVESLNAGVAASLLLYEAARQRRGGGRL